MGLQPPGHSTFTTRSTSPQLRKTIDTIIHYSFEQVDDGTQIAHWLALDITTPILLRPLRRRITQSIDKENVRTMAAVKQYAKAHHAASSASGS